MHGQASGHTLKAQVGTCMHTCTRAHTAEKAQQGGQPACDQYSTEGAWLKPTLLPHSQGDTILKQSTTLTSQAQKD